MGNLDASTGFRWRLHSGCLRVFNDYQKKRSEEPHMTQQVKPLRYQADNKSGFSKSFERMAHRRRIFMLARSQ